MEPSGVKLPRTPFPSLLINTFKGAHSDAGVTFDTFLFVNHRI